MKLIVHLLLFFFNDTATTEIYTLSLHDALPISPPVARRVVGTQNKKETTMRFMVLVKANKDSEAGVLPDEKILTEMGKFNIELEKAGVMLAGEGLQASSKGARVRFSGSKRTVIDGPFAETKELIKPEFKEQEKRLREGEIESCDS